MVKNPTYRNLQKFLSKLTQEQLDSNISIYDSNWEEFFPCIKLRVSDDTNVLEPATGILDDKHPYLEF